MAPIAFDRQKATVRVSENRLTPLEIAKLLEGDGDLPFTIAPLLKSGQRPVAYTREAWSEDATYFTSGSGASRLLVVFSAVRGRLGTTTSQFLQSLRDDVYDVVLLRDPNELHYTRGIRGLGGFLETMRRIEDFAGAKRFQQIITFGHSVGGLPALRGGRLLKATRAVSVGARGAWHPGRLTRAEKSVDAFDLLCACASPSPTELVFVYPRRHEVDKTAFELVQRTFPECIGVPIDIENHDILGYFSKAGQLPLFLACLLDYWDEADIRTDLLQRLECAARLVPNARSNRRPAQLREWLRAAPFTWPVRAVRRVLRLWSNGSR